MSIVIIMTFILIRTSEAKLIALSRGVIKNRLSFKSEKTLIDLHDHRTPQYVAIFTLIMDFIHLAIERLRVLSLP